MLIVLQEEAIMSENGPTDERLEAIYDRWARQVDDCTTAAQGVCLTVNFVSLPEKHAKLSRGHLFLQDCTASPPCVVI